ncbi:MAG TPA: heparinase II/III family protein, partial [bacterium]|nr:heparinase II/III family protein [bacterium]
PVVTRNPFPYHPRQFSDYIYAEILATRLQEPEERAGYEALLKEMEDRGADPSKLNVKWRVYHRTPGRVLSGTLTPKIKSLLDGSFFFGQTGFAIFRKGLSDNAHAAIFRFGPSLVHGHLDDLNVNYFAQGYELTYDLGYSLGSTHTQVGWAKQTIAHNTVVVDQQSQAGTQFGGSLLRFLDLPEMALAEATSNAYREIGVDTYRRLIVLTGDYLLDVFRVKGGTTHDLPLHALSVDMSVEGLELGSVQKGSLAGQDFRWGHMQMNDGDMSGYPNKPSWNPPPGNGYGFLVDVQSATPTQPWKAAWQIPDGSDTRLSFLPLYQASDTVFSATTPGLYPHFPRARHIIRRRQGENLSSCFVSVWQAGTASYPDRVRSITRLDRGLETISADSALAVQLDLGDDIKDIWFLNPHSDTFVDATVDGQTARFKGSLARCRLQAGELTHLVMLDASEIAIGGWVLRLDQPARSASVASLPDGSPQLRIGPEWSDDARYDGCPVFFSNSSYTHQSVYTVQQCRRRKMILQQSDTLLGRAVVHEILDASRMTTLVPHEYARHVLRKSPSGYFRGKKLCNESRTVWTTVHSVKQGAPVVEIEVDSTTGFKAGDVFFYNDIQPGDTLTVQHFVELKKLPEGTWALNANTDVMVSVPDSFPAMAYTDASGAFKALDRGAVQRGSLPDSGETFLRPLQ